MSTSDIGHITKLIVFGHTGFVGRQLYEYFKEKYPDIKTIGLSSTEIDLTDPHEVQALEELFTPSTGVFMCSGVKSNYSNDLESYLRNMKMAENISRVLSKHPVSKFIFLSSIAVYGVDVHATDINERSDIRPDTYYGLAKYTSECLLSLACSRNSPGNLVVLRIPTIYGANEKIIAPTPSGFLTTYMNGKEVTLWGGGSDRREFLYIIDLVRICELMLGSTHSGILNCSDGLGGHSYKEALDIISRILSRKLPINSRERTKKKIDKTYDTSLFRSIFPEFRFTPLTEGLKEIYAIQSQANGHRCILCNSKDLYNELHFGHQAICNRYSNEPKHDDNTYAISLAQCQSCGLIQLADKVPNQELTPNLEWVTYIEPEEHLDRLATEICGFQDITKETRVLGISYKDASLLDRLASQELPAGKILTPSTDLGIDDLRAGVEAIQFALTPARASEIVTKEGTFDLIIARHILEHAYDLKGFLSALSSLLSEKGYLVIEIPDCIRSFENKNYGVIWEEHISYFTLDTLRTALILGGYESVEFRIYHYALEDSIVAIARKGSEKQLPTVPPYPIQTDRKAYQEFCRQFTPMKIALHAYLSNLCNKGHRIAFFGAGHLTCSVINLFDISRYILFVVDNDKNKIGFHMAGSGLPIFEPRVLVEQRIDVCLLGVNPANENNLLSSNNHLLSHCESVYSIFPESNRALPPIKRSGRNMELIGDGIYVARDAIIQLGSTDCFNLIRAACSEKKGRARICIHQEPTAIVHEMIIAVTKNGYIRPHKHFSKAESFHVIQGLLDILVFDDHGQIVDVIKLGDFHSGRSFYYHLPMNTYHAVMLDSENALFHEVTKGPFSREDSLYAPWSPAENDSDGVANFIKVLDDSRRLFSNVVEVQ